MRIDRYVGSPGLEVTARLSVEVPAADVRVPPHVPLPFNAVSGTGAPRNSRRRVQLASPNPDCSSARHGCRHANALSLHMGGAPRHHRAVLPWVPVIVPAISGGRLAILNRSTVVPSALRRSGGAGRWGALPRFFAVAERELRSPSSHKAKPLSAYGRWAHRVDQREGYALPAFTTGCAGPVVGARPSRIAAFNQSRTTARGRLLCSPRPSS